MKHPIRNRLEQFSRAMLSPLSYLSAVGLLLALGALLTSQSLGTVLPVLQLQPIRLAGQLLYQCCMVVVNNLSVLFCVGIAAALARQNKQQAAIIALMSYLMYLTAGHVTLYELGQLAAASPQTGLYGTGQATVLGIQTVDMGVFGGILLGLAAGWVYNRTCTKQFRGVMTQLYSGARWSFVCTVAAAVVFGAGACFFWPPVQRGISALTGLIAASGNFGLFWYGFLERFLIPTGLHHLVYTPFQFTALGGSLSVNGTTYTGAYSVMMAEYNLGLPFSESIVWMYTGFTKTFGYIGIAAAFLFCARKDQRRRTAAILVPLVATAALASITEPLDFLFCFAAPVLWAAHACIAGTFMVLLRVCHVTGFTNNLLSAVLLNLSAGAQRTNYPVLYLLALCEIAVYFVVFTVLIKALDLPTPGRTAPEEPPAPEPVPAVESAAIRQLLAALGGAENICTVDNCFTRLRVTVRDPARVDAETLARLPASGVVQSGTDVQIVYGLQAAQVRRAVEQALHRP